MNNPKDHTLLKEIINEIDPVGLVDSDTPESWDEYHAELDEIFKENISLLNREQLSQRLYEVFKSFFNEEIVGSQEKYDLIANRFFTKRKEDTDS